MLRPLLAIVIAVGTAIALLAPTPVRGVLSCPRPVFQSTFEGVPAAVYEAFANAHASADFNGDGLLDVVVAGTRFNQFVRTPIKILLNDGNRGFVDGTSAIMTNGIPARYNPRELVVADFNGDGRPDVFVAAHGVDSVLNGEPNVLLLSTSGNRLTDASDRLPQRNDFTHSVAAGDIDGDGDVDILVGNFLGVGDHPFPYFLLNDGTGRFTRDTSRLPAAELTLAIERGPMGAVLLVDLSGDGAPDLVIGDHHARPSRVYLNDGAGFFRNATRITLPPDTIGGEPVDTVDVVALDVDDDGAPDLLLSNVGTGPHRYRGRNIQVLLNRGARFVDETDVRIPAARLGPVREEWFAFLDVLDFNGDGHPDILVKSVVTGGTDPHPSTPYVFVNDGRGRFDRLTARMFRSQTTYLGPLERVDLRGDGSRDFVSLGYRFQRIEELRVYQACVDLRVTALTAPPATALPGATVPAAFTVKNAGTEAAETPSQVRFYLSLDRSKSAADLRTTTVEGVPALAAHATVSRTTSLTVPATTRPGQYFVLACSDDGRAVAEADEANNCRASASQLTVLPAPDLRVASVSAPPSSVTAGSAFVVHAATRNIGTGPAPASRTSFYLSRDRTRGQDVRLQGAHAVRALAAGTRAGAATTVTVPASAPAAAYYVLACADDARVVSEISEVNNCTVSGETVSVVAP